MAYNMDRWRELLPDGWRPSWLPQMPFTDYHQLNLDWIIETVKEWSERLIAFFDEDGAKDLVEEVLDEHPEWVTTVQDGSITKPKINAAFLPEIENAYVTPEMFGAVGNGVTDDSAALSAAFNDGRPVWLNNKNYLVNTPITINNRKGLTVIGEAGRRSTITLQESLTLNGSGILPQWGMYYRFDSVFFTGPESLILNYGLQSAINNCEFNPASLQITNESHYTNINNCRFTGENSGIYNNCNGVHISDCFFSYCSTPINNTGNFCMIENVNIEGFNGPIINRGDFCVWNNVHIERNTSGIWMYDYGNSGIFELIAESDGGHFADPAININGDYNTYKIAGTGYTVATITSGADSNTVNLAQYHSLLDARIYGPINNLNKITGPYSSIIFDSAVSDLRDYITATNYNLTKNSDGSILAVSTAAGQTLAVDFDTINLPNDTKMVFKWHNQAGGNTLRMTNNNNFEVLRNDYYLYNLIEGGGVTRTSGTDGSGAAFVIDRVILCATAYGAENI